VASSVVSLASVSVGAASSPRRSAAAAAVGAQPDHVAQHAGGGAPLPDLSTRVARGVGEQRVEYVAARREQHVDPGAVLDSPDGEHSVEAERGLPRRWRAAREYPIEQPPTRQLHDPTARDAMRRQRVARLHGLVDESDIVARPGQQQRGRCPRAARSDDHDVVMGSSHGTKLCAGLPGRTWRSGGGPVETDADRAPEIATSPS
jgi:hypothetical protein